MCAFFSTLIIWILNFRFQSSFRAQNFVLFSPSPFIHLLLPPSSYPWLPMVVSFFLTNLLLEVASPIIFLPSPFRRHDLQEAKDSIDEEDPRPTSSTWSYIMWYQEHLHLGDVLLLPSIFIVLSLCSILILLIEF